jgi:hypothetical protein
LAGTEVLPIVQSGATVKVASDDLTVRNIRANATTGILQVTGPAAASTRVVTVPNANWTAARTDAAQSFTGDQTLSTGNLVQGTAAKGFNFTANTPAAGMTSQLLNWYEEGTFTPVLKFSGATTGITYSTQVGKYTRVGRLVTAYLKIALSSKGSASGSGEIYGLPFTVPTGGLNVPVSVYISAVTFTGSINFHAEGTTDRIALQQVSTLGAVTYLTDGNFANTSVVEVSISYMV